MDEFEVWVNEMISRMETVDRKIKENGKLNGEATRLLMDRAIQPFGLWNPEQTVSSGKSTIAEIAGEFGLSIDGNILRLPKSGVSKEQFSKLAKRLEKVGYEYKKGKYVFGPKWNEVKQ